jgi:hypothetical protein
MQAGADIIRISLQFTSTKVTCPHYHSKNLMFNMPHATKILLRLSLRAVTAAPHTLFPGDCLYSFIINPCP